MNINSLKNAHSKTLIRLAKVVFSNPQNFLEKLLGSLPAQNGPVEQLNNLKAEDFQRKKPKLSQTEAFQQALRAKKHSVSATGSSYNDLKNKPILSICVSTYNRSHYLKASLPPILDAADEFGALIEVIVCDNASTDETELFIESLRATRNFKYVRNKTNVGMLGNLAVTAQAAKGQFLWILGDDDVILPNVIARVIQAIIDNPTIEFIYTNYSYTHLSLSGEASLADLLASQTLAAPVSDDYYVDQLVDISANTANFFTAIYCCIFRSDHGKKAYSQNTQGRPFSSLLTCVPTTAYIADSMLDRPAYWIGTPAVLINMNVSWLQHADLWVLERFPEIYSLFEFRGSSSEKINQFRKDSFGGVVHYLRSSLARNSPNLELINLVELMRSYAHLPGFRTLAKDLIKILSEYPDNESNISIQLIGDAIEIPPLLVEGPFVGSYSLAIVNRLVCKALVDKGQKACIGPSPTEGTPFAPPRHLIDDDTWQSFQASLVHSSLPHWTLRYTFPPTTEKMNGVMKLYHSFGWEESAFPQEYINAFNKDIDGITVMSTFVRDVLIRHGIKVPVFVTGLGVDHFDGLNYPAKPQDGDYITNKKQFTFLHISSCFPRKAPDVLLNSYFAAFSGNDPVLLIIKTFPNPHNNVEELLSALQKSHANPPLVELINEDWLEPEKIRDLYLRCDVVVIPSRGEGFGFPIAEALWAEKPVIATGYGGHMDFLGEDYPWLIDFTFEASKSHFSETTYSCWANPSTDHLRDLLRVSYESSANERQLIARTWKERLDEKCRWAHVVDRIVEAAHRTKALQRIRVGQRRETQAATIALVSTWDTKCGIAEYSRHLFSGISESMFHVFSNQDALLTDPTNDEELVTQCWEIGSLEGIAETISAGSFRVAVFQYQPSFYPISHLQKAATRLVSRGICVVIILHNAAAFVERLNPEFTAMLCGKKVKLVVHTIDDLNVVKRLSAGLLSNTMQFPHGTPDLYNGLPNTFSPIPPDEFTIASFGFLFPHKRVFELIQAFSIVRMSKPKSRLLLLNAVINEAVAGYADLCNNLIDDLNLRDCVAFNTSFLDQDEIRRQLSVSNLIALPYGATTESSSAAVRNCLSCGIPVICSNESIFEEFSGVTLRFNSTSIEDMAANILTLIENPNVLKETLLRQNRWIEQNKWSVISPRFEALLQSIIVDHAFNL